MRSRPCSSSLPVALLAALAVPSLALTACSSGGSSGGDVGTAVPTTVTRDLAPQASSSDVSALVSGNTDFAFGLYKGLASASASNGGGSTNLFFSPYSVSLALAMLYAGAEGETRTQMATALDFTLPDSALNPAFDKLDLGIQKVSAGASGADGSAFAMKIADALWGDQSVTFSPTFVNTIAANYDGGLRTVDFVHDSTQAEAAINGWVASETDDLIDPLLPAGAVNPDTRLVIVNAIYFDAGWATAFDPSATTPGTFTRADGTTVTTPIMSSSGQYGPGAATTYAKGKNYQAVELPYSGGDKSMVIVLPNAGQYAAVEAGLDAGLFAEVTGNLSTQPIVLTMPKFKIHGASVSLTSELSGLGMVDAFDADKADFTGIIPTGGVYVSDVIHQAYVDVDESGTVAAAATGITVGTAAVSVGNPPVYVDVTRSFFFFIRDVASNTVLFVGHEDDPTAT